MPKQSLLRNISIRSKIILSIYGTIVLISTILGYFAYQVSLNNITHKISSANLAMGHTVPTAPNALFQFSRARGAFRYD